MGLSRSIKPGAKYRQPNSLAIAWTDGDNSLDVVTRRVALTFSFPNPVKNPSATTIEPHSHTSTSWHALRSRCRPNQRRELPATKADRRNIVEIPKDQHRIKLLNEN